LLAYLTDATAGDHRLRVRAMSYFELSLLAGLALGGIVGGQLWAALGTSAFTALSLIYVVAALLLFTGSVGSQRHRRHEVWQGLIRSLATPSNAIGWLHGSWRTSASRTSSAASTVCSMRSTGRR
jgi:hypothetical protein